MLKLVKLYRRALNLRFIQICF